MRLWSQQLIPYLDRQRLLGQHRECAALRGKGWSRKHSVVDYVFTYSPSFLIAYHYLIMDEMKARGYNPDSVWRNLDWRGNVLGEQIGWAPADLVNQIYEKAKEGHVIYDEHNSDYLQECIDILRTKGVEIKNDSCSLENYNHSSSRKKL